jgi:hypothetical protein
VARCVIFILSICVTETVLLSLENTTSQFQTRMSGFDSSTELQRWHIELEVRFHESSEMPVAENVARPIIRRTRLGFGAVILKEVWVIRVPNWFIAFGVGIASVVAATGISRYRGRRNANKRGGFPISEPREPGQGAGTRGS